MQMEMFIKEIEKTIKHMEKGSITGIMEGFIVESE